MMVSSIRISDRRIFFRDRVSLRSRYVPSLVVSVVIGAAATSKRRAACANEGRSAGKGKRSTNDDEEEEERKKACDRGARSFETKDAPVTLRRKCLPEGIKEIAHADSGNFVRCEAITDIVREPCVPKVNVPFAYEL